MIPVTHNLSICEDDFELSFIRSSGPGGQNVNKVSSAVQLRFNILHSSLPEDVQKRLIRLVAGRLTQKGEIIIHAHQYRSQLRNREDAVQRLVELVRNAAFCQQIRKPTQPTLASRQRRQDNKVHRSQVKSLRRKHNFFD